MSRKMQQQRERPNSLIASSGSEDRNMTIKWPNHQSIRRVASAMMNSSMLLRLSDSKDNMASSSKQGDSKKQRNRRPRSRNSSRPRASPATTASAAPAPPSLQPSNHNRSSSASSIPLNNSQSNLRPSNSNSSSIITQWMVDHYPDQPLPSIESSSRSATKLVRTAMSDPQQQQQQQQQQQHSNKSSRRKILVRKEMLASSDHRSRSEPRSKRKTRKITLEPKEHQQPKEVQPLRPSLKQKSPQQQQQQLPIIAPTINLVRGVNNDDDNDNTVISDTESVFTMERTFDGDGEEDTVTLESSFTLMEMKRSTCRMLHDEIMGVWDDTCRSIEQVFTAFTLQEADVKAVCSRIDRAKVQMNRSLKIKTIHEEKRNRGTVRRVEL